MSDTIVIDTQKLRDYGLRLNTVNSHIKSIDRRMDSLYTKVGLNGLFDLLQADILAGYSIRLSACKTALVEISEDFEKVEKECAVIDWLSKDFDKDALQVFYEEFKANYGWKEILSGSNYISRIYGIISGVKKAESMDDLRKAALEVYDFSHEAKTTFDNYKKIGNAVGATKSMSWWLKNITGLKKLNGVSTAKKFSKQFKNNLTNTRSPYNKMLNDVIDDFKGTNGAGKAVASWASVAVSGVVNWFGNKEEQAASSGKMSDTRVAAETVMETVVDTVLTYSASAVVGAAVSAVLPVAAPGILVVAATGATVALINAGVKAVTEKSVTELISDGILDTGKAIGDAVSGVAKSVGKWFGKLSFT